tara:strand:+ start:6376 stop:7260 length:885 start_codon:yes stop_codon:yes gene_type:complete
MKTKKVYLIIPLYNDWKSLNKLLGLIDKKVNSKKTYFNILIVNDCSTESNEKTKYKFRNIKSIKIINLKKNVGHDRALAIGLKILEKKFSFDYAITMDSDGEDNPKYINNFLKKIKNEQNTIIVAKRKKRSVSLIFSILYFIHLSFLFIFSGTWLNFGGYNCLSRTAVLNLLKEKTLWGNYSATIALSNIKIDFLNTDRSKRYFGPSQMNYFKLFLHSLSILSVFKKNIFLLSALLIFINLLMVGLQNSLIFYVPIIILILINLLILLMSKRESILWIKNINKNIFYISKLFNK